MLVVALLAAAAGLPGCAAYYYGEKYGPTLGSMLGSSTRLVDASYQATDALLQTVALDTAQPVLVTTLVNVDQPSESSRLGRIVTEQIAGRMVQRGVQVTELKLRDTVALQGEQGQRLLSRELREASQAYHAQAVVVGTYAVSSRQVFVSLKMLLPEGNVVVAAHDYALPLDEDVRALLAGR